MKLTIKQEKFCNKYIECGNASEAYRFAYDCSKMKDATVNRASIALLEDYKITTRVQELQEELKKKSDISKESILRDLSAVMNADIMDYVELKEYLDEEGTPTGATYLTFVPFYKLTKEQRKAIQGIKRGQMGIELKLQDKSKAMDTACKMLGFYAPIRQDVKLDEDTVKLIVGMKVQ